MYVLSAHGMKNTSVLTFHLFGCKCREQRMNTKVNFNVLFHEIMDAFYEFSLTLRKCLPYRIPWKKHNIKLIFKLYVSHGKINEENMSKIYSGYFYEFWRLPRLELALTINLTRN